MIGLLALWACGGAVAPPAPIPVTPLVPPTCARTRRVLTPTWGEGHYSYAAAVVRSEASSTFAVSMANGHDHELDNVFLLPDGNGEFTRKMGMLVDKSNVGFGMRSWRYSMLVDDCKIEKIFIEQDFGDNCPTDPFEVSDADTMMAYLKGTKSAGVSKPVKAFEG